MKKHIPFLLILSLGVGLRIWWWSYTRHTAEDAHITFQFARMVAEQAEFAFNPGQPIYGSTTPLLTILLSLWYEFNTDIVLGSKVIALLAFAGGMIFLYQSLEGHARWIAPLLVATSFRLIAEDMSGMEMSLLFFFMMGSIRGLFSREIWISGLMCGFLLWARMDMVVFVIAMAIAHFLNKKPVLPFLAGTLIYVPWLVFAWYYFGSPIPFTVIAKEVAYGTPSSFGEHWKHLVAIANYLSLSIVITTLVAFYFTGRRVLFLCLFIAFEVAFLGMTGSTFFPRYFYLLTTACLIVIAIAIPALRDYRLMILASTFLIAITFNTEQISYYKNLQENRYAVLQQIGAWLNANTDPESTVLLEPLGYVGYGAQRIMLDEVGLITPRVVELHRQDVGGKNFFRYLHTDYILFQCHQADGVMDDLRLEYEAVQLFTDTSFRGCYELWRSK